MAREVAGEDNSAYEEGEEEKPPMSFMMSGGSFACRK